MAEVYPLNDYNSTAKLPSNIEIEGCLHEKLDESGSCFVCGLNFQVFSQPKIRRNKKGSIESFNNDVMKLDIGDDIKDAARNVYLKIGQPTHRKTKRSLMIFFCVYMGGLEIGRPISPISLSSKLGITTAEGNRSISMFSESQTGYRPPKTRVIPTDRLRDFCEELSFSTETAEMAISWAREILNQDARLAKETPQKVAAGLLRYFMEMHNMKISDDEFKKLVGYSLTTVKDVYTRVGQIDNS